MNHLPQPDARTRATAAMNEGLMSIISRFQKTAVLMLLSVWFTACDGDGTDPEADATSAVDSIVLNLDSADLTVGDTVRLTAVPKDSKGQIVTGITVVWTSTNPAVAKVSPDGLVTTLQVGEAVIEATVTPTKRQGGVGLLQPAAAIGWGARRDQRSSLRLFVWPTVVHGPANGQVDVGKTIPFTVRFLDDRGNDLSIPLSYEWISANTSIATVDGASGLAKGVKTGTTQIVLKVWIGSRSKEYSHTLYVTVCGGINEVEKWTAELDVFYVPSPVTVRPHEFTVIYSTSAKNVLLVRPTTGADDKVLVWEGKVSEGTASIDNLWQNILETGEKQTMFTEKGNTLSGGDIRLEVEVASCMYRLRYKDLVEVTVRSAVGGMETVKVPVGEATWKEKSVPPAPAEAGSEYELRAANEVLPGKFLLAGPSWSSDNNPAFYGKTPIYLGMFEGSGASIIESASASYIVKCTSGCPNDLPPLPPR